MSSKFKPVAVAVAVVALLALAPAAMAQGGAGGGGGGGGATSCGTIDSFDMSSGYTADGQPMIGWRAQTTNNCFDRDRAGTVAIDYSNSVDGYLGRSLYGGRGTMTFGSSGPAPAGETVTITITVYTPGGKVAATQTRSATAPPALVAAG